jgi:hypothetical protein
MRKCFWRNVKFCTFIITVSRFSIAQYRTILHGQKQDTCGLNLIQPRYREKCFAWCTPGFRLRQIIGDVLNQFVWRRDFHAFELAIAEWIGIDQRTV